LKREEGRVKRRERKSYKIGQGRDTHRDRDNYKERKRNLKEENGIYKERKV